MYFLSDHPRSSWSFVIIYTVYYCNLHLSNYVTSKTSGLLWPIKGVWILMQTCIENCLFLLISHMKSHAGLMHRWLHFQRFPSPFTVTLCSPVLGWVKISTWMDTSPTASSTPEPDRTDRQRGTRWCLWIWKHGLLSQTKHWHKPLIQILLLLLLDRLQTNSISIW